MEWHTDQMPEHVELSPIGLSNCLGICVLALAKEQCFYLIFRLHASSAQFLQTTTKSRVLQAAKRGERLSFDPSMIPFSSHGEPQIIGDVLIKDAAMTHRGQYLKYLRASVLPPDTPVFDLKGLPNGPRWQQSRDHFRPLW